MNLIEEFRKLRNAGAPIAVIETSDQSATVKTLIEGINGTAHKVIWSLTNGLVPAGPESEAALATVDPARIENESRDLSRALMMCTELEGAELPGKVLPGLSPKSILILKQGGEFMGDLLVQQCLLDVRDAFKANLRTCVVLGKSVKIPALLKDDVVLLTEDAPSHEVITSIITQNVADYNRSVGEAQMPEIEVSEEEIARATHACHGIGSAGGVEQITALCLSESGIDHAALIRHKIQAIERVPGLGVHQGNESFDDIGGVTEAIKYLKNVCDGRDEFQVIVYIDEIEKMLAASSTDSSGVSQDQMGTLLPFMEDNEAEGMLFIGSPGTAKSAVAKALGPYSEKILIKFDPGAAKGSLVGQSQAMWRECLSTIKAVSNGKMLFIGTCNSLETLPPALRRRFNLGTFYFDIPDADERDAIWPIYLKRYELEDDATKDEVDDHGWTGAEIKKCCMLAWKLRRTLIEASKSVIPVSRSDSKELEKLRKQAHQKYLSASRPGEYQKDAAVRRQRTMGTEKPGAN